MNQLEADRFAEWYHFIKDKVEDHEFDMDCFCSDDPNNLFKKDKCGTTGCLAGYLPVIFEDFCYPSKDSEVPCLISKLPNIKVISKNNKDKIFIKDIYNEEFCVDSIIEQVAEFFGLTKEESEDLINPSGNTDKEFMLFKMYNLADKYGWDIA